MDPGGAAVTATATADAGRGPLGGSSGNKRGRGGSAGGDGGSSGGRENKQARAAAGDASSDATASAARFSVVDGSPGGGGEHMLSFSTSAASSRPAPVAAAAADAATPLYYGTPASCSGLSSVSLSASMQGAMARVRGPFTPSQWVDLEHQALIYKYLAANRPIPHDLLIPIRRSLASSYSPAYFGTSGSGWGPFQMGYPGNADLEPGRCRRTDGKKWRCSRDAVADQKYCERHMNRGRHRSRKHVEGQPGHAAKAMSVAVGAAAASATQPGAQLAASGTGATAAELAVNQNQQPTTNYATGASDPCSLQFNRELMTKHNESENMQESDNLSMLTSMNTRNSDSIFPFSKQNNPFEVTSSRTDLGLVSSDSLMCSHSPLQNVNSQVLNEHQGSAFLQHFVDWPRTPVQGGFTWPYPEDMRAQRTQLSVSAPMASSELSSASTSPAHEKLMLSPLKLSREYSSVGRSIAATRDEAGQVQGNWMFRDSSMGGPLGEVLTKNSNAEAMNYMSAPALNLLTGCWDSSPGLDSSPVGVLQKTAFGSLSSSTGSSPRMENHHSAYDICNPPDDLGSIVVSHPSIRLL